MRTLFLSHRGESDSLAENTAMAFSLAMQRTSDGIELDVRLTADKQVVCVHDATMTRVSGVELAVADSTLAELQKIHPVPLLSEALEILKPGAIMQIELKGKPDVIPYAREVIAQFPEKRNQFSISSFENDTIEQAAAAFPDLPRLLLINLASVFGHFPSAAEVIEYLKPLKCGVSFKADYRADKEFVQTLQDAGLRVVCWGVSSDEIGMAMADLGIAALTSNHAVALRKKYLER